MKGRRCLRYLPPLSGLLLLLLFPKQAGDGVRAGLVLSGTVLVPALFPVSVLAGCLLRMGAGRDAERLAGPWMERVFGLPGAAAVPLLMGLLGGFPLGAQLTAASYGDGLLDRRDAALLSGLSCGAGPAFLLGVAGGVLGSPAFGLCLLAIQLFSVLLTGLLLRQSYSKTSAETLKAPPESPSFALALPTALGESAAAMLRLTGAVAFFQAAYACLEGLLPLSALSAPGFAAVSAFLELSGGIAQLRGASIRTALPLAACAVGWGGLCVHLQAAEALTGAGLPLGPYLRTKALQAGICLLSALVFIDAAEKRLSPVSVCSGGILLFLIFFAVFKKIHWKSTASVI